MAVDIDAFKRDLDTLKNQRSVIQAKLDEANRHVDELKNTLAGMGFNSVDEAKQAYAKQVGEAEAQHAVVKQLIAEISQVDSNVPSREEVAARLASLSFNQQAPANVQTNPVSAPVAHSGVSNNNTVISTPVMQQAAVQAPNNAVAQPVQAPVNDFVQQQVIPPQVPGNVNSQPKQGNNSVDALGGLLFANL